MLRLQCLQSHSSVYSAGVSLLTTRHRLGLLRSDRGCRASATTSDRSGGAAHRSDRGCATSQSIISPSPVQDWLHQDLRQCHTGRLSGAVTEVVKWSVSIRGSCTRRDSPSAAPAVSPIEAASLKISLSRRPSCYPTFSVPVPACHHRLFLSEQDGMEASSTALGSAYRRALRRVYPGSANSQAGSSNRSAHHTTTSIFHSARTAFNSSPAKEWLLVGSAR